MSRATASGGVRIDVTGARGASAADVARRTGAWGALSTDSDPAVLEKFAQFAIEENPGFQSSIPGPSNNTRLSLADLKAAATSDRTSLYDGSLWTWTLGDYTGKADDRVVVEANSTALTVGAWVRRTSSSPSVSVKDFGARGDGATNDTAAINAANIAASIFGVPVRFPDAGTYLTDPTVALGSWIGHGAVIKNRGNQSTFVPLVTASGIDDVRFEGLTFDGSVSADPANWTSANYDSFTGAAGLSVENCLRPAVSNCRAIGTRRHGFRFVNCQGAAWELCYSSRARGNFGDGFVAISCVGLSVTRCRAEDYTRIGFVVDSFGEAIATSHKVSFDKCFAIDGHDGSDLYGGGEFNAGFWCEHTGDVSLSNCFAWDNFHRGINVCTGSANNGFQGTRAAILIENCQTFGGRYGIYTYSLDGLPVDVKVANSMSKGARVAFEGDARSASDSFAWVNCHADYDASSNVGRGFACEAPVSLAGRPSFLVGPGCTISRYAENLTFLDDNGDAASTADVGGGPLPATAIRLTVDGLRHVDDKPIYVRWYEGRATNVQLTNIDTGLHVRRGGSSGGRIKAESCTIHSFVVTYGAPTSIEVKDCLVVGAIAAAATRIDFCTNTVQISDGSMVWLRSASASKFPAFFVNGNRFEKNINDFDAVLRLGFQAVTFQALITSNLFYNTGPASATKPFLQYAAGTLRQWAANFADDSVTNITALDSGGGAENVVAGVSKIAMR